MLPERSGQGEPLPGKPMFSLRPIAAALLATGLFLPSGFAALAEPLEPAECKALQSQKQTLLTATVRAALSRGPDWVKEHLHNEEKIEQVREYLDVEAKVKFRCRTDGVRIPKPLPPPLPHRKPPVPTYVVDGETPKILAGVAATSFLPLRKPGREQPQSIEEIIAGDGEAAGDGAAGDGAAPLGGTRASQAVAGSDKSAPSENKATQ